MGRTRRLCLVLLCLLGVSAIPARSTASETQALWDMLRSGGTIAMIRHARAPGTGDPAEFVLEDCTTQRNLSDAGRDQARALGEAFRRQSVPVAGVLSSRWCRCLETARLAFGRVQPFPPLDSFFETRWREAEQTEALRRELAGWDGQGTLVLVTHQVNITALTGIFPREGEIIVLTRAPGGMVRVAGRLFPAAS